MDQESLVMDALDLANRPTPHDVASLESYLAALKTHADGVLALGDGMDGETWFRTHSTLVTSGLWRRLKPCSRSVYVVLSAAADRRKRCTIIGAVRVAERAGLSVPRVLFAYKELKDFGLIRRWRIKLGPYQPYLTVLTAPSRWSPAA